MPTVTEPTVLDDDDDDQSPPPSVVVNTGFFSVIPF